MPRKLVPPGKNTSYDDAIHYMRWILPAWFEWPRELRRVYMLLDSHGASPASLESICNTLGYSQSFLNKMIHKVPSFQAAFDEFALRQEYPVKNMSAHRKISDRKQLKRKDLAWLFNNESALVYLVALEQDISNKKISHQHAARMIAGAGFADQVNTLDEDAPPEDDDNPTDSGLPRFDKLVPINGAIPVSTEPLATEVPRDSSQA